MTRRFLFILLIVAMVFSSISAVNAMDNEDLNYGAELISKDADDLVVNNETNMVGIGEDLASSGISSNRSTHLDAHDVVKYHKNGTNFEATLTDYQGNSIADQYVTFDIKNVKAYTLKTNVNGVASLPINLRVGTYTINVIFEGNSLYDSCSDVATLKVLPSVVGGNLIKYYKNGTQYTVTVMGKDKPLAGANISFTIPGKTYYATTDNNGVASLTINLLPGTYTITATNLVDNTSCTNTIRVLSTLTTNDLTKGYLDNCQFSVKVVNGSGSPLVGTKVIFNIVGKNYTKTTNSQGIAILPINLIAGTYSITTTNQNDGLKYTNTIKVLTGLDTYIKPNSYLVDDKITTIIYNSLNHTIPNLEVTFTVDGRSYTSTSDSNGIVIFNNTLNEGSYNATFKFAGNDIYKASIIKVMINIFPGMTNLNTSIPFKYSFLIPNYVNVTGPWRVLPHTCGEKYYVAGGAGGIVKLPTTRLLLTPTKNSWIEYRITSDGIYQDDKRIGSSITLTLWGDGMGSILIKTNNDYINITYTGFLNTTISQVSGLFKHDYNGIMMHDYENIQVILNGQVMMDIFVSDPVSYDDEGLRLQLAQGRVVLPSSSIPIFYLPYDKFPNYDAVKFVNTWESLTFSDDMKRIINFPSKEKVITSFSFNGANIVKPETIGYGLNKSLMENGFEVVQSFCISNTRVSDIIIKYYLEQNNSFPTGAMKAVYGTFLTALSTNWMYDNLIENLTDIYNVSSTRNKYNVVMSGVELGGTSYVHCPDPSMGVILNGDNSTNVIICRLISSLLLSEIEYSALNLAGINSTSSVTGLFTRILNLENFTVTVEGNYLTITLRNSSEYKIILDLNTGLVYDLYQKENFVYKGTISTVNSYCYHNDLTNRIHYNLKKGYNNKGYGLSKEDEGLLKSFMVDCAAGLGLSVASIGVEHMISIALVGGLAPPMMLAVPAAFAIGGFAVCVVAKTYNHDGDLGKGFGDSLLNLAYNVAKGAGK